MPDLPFKHVTVGLLEVNCCLVQLPGSRTLYVLLLVAVPSAVDRLSQVTMW